MRWLLVMTLGVPGLAAAACEAQVKKLEPAQGADVAPAFAALAACDAPMAGEQFGAALKRTGDVESLVALARAALDAGLTDRVQAMLEQIPDYAAREEAARYLGGLCGDDPKVLAFVQGLHGALKDRAFVSWAGALRSCPSDALTADLEKLATAVPSHAFDDKYATVVDLYATRKKAAALPVLEKAAQSAAKGGPFPVVVDAMVKAVTPDGFGGKPSAADRDALVAALGRVAGSATPDQVTVLANELVSVEALDAAAALLPKIYPDRVQSGGGFLYGVAAVEACGGETLVHWAAVEDSGKRWSVDAEARQAATTWAPKLKCKEPAPMVISLTPGPVKAQGDIETWATGLAGAEGKLKAEKALTLP